ncbi:hypothetical protein [Nonomuraea rhizosphaerae]|uniref:hypothetical protein n=1 Tax=Nonomuraea rhizosphaerae TaxID=2665663 RepID=UPI001C605A6B|nr:hypothetical protein [Nonomuraea rhizosphaerae]
MGSIRNRSHHYSAVLGRLHQDFPMMDSHEVESMVKTAADCARHVGCTPTDEVVERLALEHLRARMATRATLPRTVRA